MAAYLTYIPLVDPILPITKIVIFCFEFVGLWEVKLWHSKRYACKFDRRTRSHVGSELFYSSGHLISSFESHHDDCYSLYEQIELVSW